AVSVIVQLLEALEYAHSREVAHCGVKASGLLLTSKGQIKIMDFGISDLDRTMPGYVSAEPLDDSSPDRRVDLLAAGILFYELLTGMRPFSIPEDVVRVVSRGQPPSNTNPDVSAVLDEVCARALQERPKD